MLLVCGIPGHARPTAETGQKLPVDGPAGPLAAPAIAVGLSGRAGYVHFFELTWPDGTLEAQVGIETEDGRIAWSVPGEGVIVSAFPGPSVRWGGVEHGIRHLYGLPAFADTEPMARFERIAALRIAGLVDNSIGYCNGPLNRDRSCLSCLGFVLQVMFPGPYPQSPRLPADFRRTRSHAYYTTDDLLLYLARIDDLPTREARRARVEAMSLPAVLKDDLMELIATIDPAERSWRTAAHEPKPAPARNPRMRSAPGVRKKL